MIKQHYHAAGGGVAGFDYAMLIDVTLLLSHAKSAGVIKKVKN